MFKRTLNELRRIQQGVRVSVSMPLDHKGYLDRRCGSDLCAAHFKIQFDDWRNIVRDETVYCPICRHEATSAEWDTEEQNRYYERAALAHVEHVFGSALRQDVRAFNHRQPRRGFIHMSMSFKPGTRTVVVPAGAAEAMEQNFECDPCGCRYTSVGAAFFCPACGHNSASTTFDTAVHIVIQTMTALPEIKRTVRDKIGTDAEEDTARHLIESNFIKLVSSFQRFAKAAFANLPNSGQFVPRKNVFQNLGESSRLWRKACGKGYEEMISPVELETLQRYFQQRHLIAHREGIVDEEYLSKTNDGAYSAGQRIVSSEESVLSLADLVMKLATQLKRL